MDKINKCMKNAPGRRRFFMHFFFELCGAQGRVQVCRRDKIRQINVFSLPRMVELCGAQGQKQKKQKPERKYAGS